MSVNDLNESKDLEVMTFRRNAMSCCKQYVDERESSGPAGLAMSIYPPDVHSTANLPLHIMRNIQKGAFYVAVAFIVLCFFLNDLLNFCLVNASGSVGRRPLVSSSFILRCQSHLPLAVPGKHCPHFFLQIVFPCGHPLPVAMQCPL